MPPSNQEVTSSTEMCGNFSATTSWTPPTSLRIQEAFRRENTARINLDLPSEVRFAGTKPSSSWITKAHASVRRFRRQTPYQQPPSEVVDSQTSRSYLRRVAREPMF